MPEAERLCGASAEGSVVARGEASAGTGALVYLSLPPDGDDSNVSDTTTGWWDIGGTSLSAPQWAGLLAIADQINGGGLGLINPALYKIGADPARYAADFFDVTTGNNTDTLDPPTPYRATPPLQAGIR